MKHLPSLKTGLAALALGGLALAATQHAGHAAPLPTAAAQALPLRVKNAVIVAVPPGVGDTAAHLVLTNLSARPVKLTGFSTPVARHGMLMNTVQSGGMMGMKATASLTVPARGQLVLSGGGDHLMLMGLRRPLKVGEQVALTLRASDGRALTFRAVVRKP